MYGENGYQQTDRQTDRQTNSTLIYIDFENQNFSGSRYCEQISNLYFFVNSEQKKDK